MPPTPPPTPSPSPGATPAPPGSKGPQATGNAEDILAAARQKVESAAATAPRQLEDDPQNPRVFWTTKKVKQFEEGWQDAPAPTWWGDEAVTKTKSELLQEFEGWSFELKTWFRNSLAATGVDTSNMNDGALLAYWERYIDRAAAKYAAKINMNPFEVLSLDIKQREKWQQQSMQQPKTVTQTRSDVQLSTEQDARAIYTVAAKQLLGRDPTADEVTGFFTALNARERANPQQTTTTSSYDAEGKLTSQSSVQSGGISTEARQLAAQDQAKQNPEYGAYQAATTYMDALKSMVYGRS